MVCLLGSQDLQGLIIRESELIGDPHSHREWLPALYSGMSYANHVTRGEEQGVPVTDARGIKCIFACLYVVLPCPPLWGLRAG